MKHKRILSLALALVMALALMPTAAFATDVTQAIPFQYDAVMDFKCGVAAVANGKVEHVYDDAYYFAGEYAIIDKTGKEVVPFGKYLTPALTSVYGGGVVYSYLPAFSEGYAAVRGQNLMWGYIDTTGKEVIPCQYNNAWEFSDGLARIDAGKSANHQYGFIDTAGREVISPGKYDYAYDFHEGLAAVELDGKYGFIDTTGQEIILLKYDSVKDFSEGLAAVSVGEYPNQKWGFIDATGKEVIPFQYETAGAFQNGRAVVSGSTGRVEYGRTVYGLGVIDTQGNVVVPFGKYEQQNDEDYHEGLKAVQIDSGWGYVDLNGNAVTAFQYGEPRQLSEGMLAVDLDGKWGFVRVEGLPTEGKPNQAQDAKKAQEAIITERREKTAQERREKAIQKQQNNPQYQEYLKANREFLAEHIEERDYIYTIVTDDIQNCSDEICAGLTTDAEKVLAIHKWVTENIYYDYPLLSQPHPWPTAQTVFDKKSYVCSGYTILFQALCWAQKIPCVAVAGPTRNGYHAWNAVQVDGEWSWVDATWDTFNKYYGGDQWIKGDQRMDYYRCSSEFLSTDHKATNSSSKITWSNGEWVTTEYIWCYTTNGINANLPDQSEEETQQIIEQSNKLLEEEKPLEERLAELAMENPTLSGWAKDEVVAAIKANLVPADLLDGYNTNITRQEFCSLMVMMLEQATGKKALDYIAEKGLTYQSPFTDTNLPTVGYAYTLGIVKGTSDTTFNPNGSITRQEAATMLGRAGRLLGLEAKSGTDFADRQDFPSWAVEGIAYVSGLTDPVSQKKVMEGTGDGFTPKGTYTREQGIITALRLFRCCD